MKTKPTYQGNILTSQLRDLPNGTLFSEHIFDGLSKEPVILKKVETVDNDVMIQPLCFGQYSEVPGETCRLGYNDESGKEWRVWSKENTEKMIGWLMTTHQILT